MAVAIVGGGRYAIINFVLGTEVAIRKGAPHDCDMVMYFRANPLGLAVNCDPIVCHQALPRWKRAAELLVWTQLDNKVVESAPLGLLHPHHRKAFGLIKRGNAKNPLVCATWRASAFCAAPAVLIGMPGPQLQADRIQRQCSCRQKRCLIDRLVLQVQEQRCVAFEWLNGV